MLWVQPSNLNPNIKLQFWLENNKPEELGLLLQSKGSSGLRVGPGWRGSWRAWIYRHLVERRFSISVGRYATVHQGDIYAILACAHEIKLRGRSEKYVSICRGSQAALKALQTVRTTYPLVQQYRKALNDISNPACCGAVLGLWTCWGTIKRNCPTSSQENILFTILLDLSRPWGCLRRI